MNKENEWLNMKGEWIGFSASLQDKHPMTQDELQLLRFAFYFGALHFLALNESAEETHKEDPQMCAAVIQALRDELFISCEVVAKEIGLKTPMQETIDKHDLEL